jgi:hypothetical protein
LTIARQLHHLLQEKPVSHPIPPSTGTRPALAKALRLIRRRL